jgi:hypothetical protein
MAWCSAVLGKYRNLSNFESYFAPFDYQMASLRVSRNLPTRHYSC